MTAYHTFYCDLLLKHYEIKHHLGNVRLVFKDLKQPPDLSVNKEDFTYNLVPAAVQNYYPFGLPKPGLNFSLGRYRFGFNGTEMDNDVKGKGKSLDYGMRIYNPDIGRWFSMDPEQAKYPNMSPYNFCANNPIEFVD
jgi:RHS repeat-associated protein